MFKIGFIGAGIMGKSMIRNLMKHGYEVSVYSRTKEKALDIVDAGALWSDTVKACVADVDAVITIVGYPQDVEEVYFGNEGIIENARKGCCLIDMTTNQPQLAKRIYEAARARGLKALDAPVTGGDMGARNGTLSILVGGDKDVFDECLPVFKAMGTTIVYQGTAGCGQHAKMANQIAIAGTVSGVCEAFSYAEKVGLDKQICFDAISKGAAGSAQMQSLAPKMFAGDFAPGFFIKHFIKDMRIARDEAEKAGISLNILNQVLGLYEEMAQDGLGDLGTQALIKKYTDEA